MPPMLEVPQIRVPRLVVALMLMGLFAVALLAMRQYGSVGDLNALTLAVVAGLLCLITAGGLIWANYIHYHARPNGKLNGSH